MNFHKYAINILHEVLRGKETGALVDTGRGKFRNLFF